MEQVRFSNGYTTYVDQLFSAHCINQVYYIGDGWLGINSLRDHNSTLTPFNQGDGYFQTWDIGLCHSLIFNV